MKRILAIAVLAIALSSLALAQMRSNQANQNTRVEQAIVQLENEWYEALRGTNRAAIERIEADDFSYVGFDGSKGDKALDVEMANRRTIRLENGRREEMSVRVYGDTAVATGLFLLSNGNNPDGAARFTHVWVRRQGRWQVVAAQYTRVAQR